VSYAVSPSALAGVSIGALCASAAASASRGASPLASAERLQRACVQNAWEGRLCALRRAYSLRMTGGMN
jgi:predicted acylesterase/phospholipase RssA